MATPERTTQYSLIGSNKTRRELKQVVIVSSSQVRVETAGKSVEERRRISCVLLFSVVVLSSLVRANRGDDQK